LCKRNLFYRLLKKPFVLKLIFGLLIFFLYFILPFSLRFKNFKIIILFFFYLSIFFILFFLLNRHSYRKISLQHKIDDLQEKINLLNIKQAQYLKKEFALQEKIKRYLSLKDIIDKINQDLQPEKIAEYLLEIVFSTIGRNKGICLLYLVDPQRQTLSLFKSKKEDKRIVIQAKEIDIFDQWVLKHTSSLIIEDIKEDFRFDLEKLKDRRNFSSLIASPLISENRFLGIIRLDNPIAKFYNQDDLRFLATVCDLGAVALESAELFQKTQDLAIHDGLTGLYTKNYFFQRLKDELKHSLRKQIPLSLLMFDIDYFKNYNDKFGHIAGDIVLKNLSSTLLEFFKETNSIISRFGGEEFCIILPGINKTEAKEIAEKLRQAILNTSIILRLRETQITVSIGLASFPEDAAEEEDLVLKADQAMYKAKQAGRNRVCVI